MCFVSKIILTDNRMGQFLSCFSVCVVTFGWNSSSNFPGLTHWLTIDCGFVSSGSRWFGDSLQVSLRVWRPSKNHTTSDWCCLTDAGKRKAFDCLTGFVHELFGPEQVRLVLFYWQMAVDQAQMQNLSSLFMPVESVNPCLILIVRRNNIVGDTMEVLRKSKNVDYKKPLKVKDTTIILLSLSVSPNQF